MSVELINMRTIQFDVEASEAPRIEEIFRALIKSGGLTGVKGGQTAIHFDPLGVFQKIELRYFPWQRRAS